MLEVGFGGGDLIAHIEPFVPEGSVAGVDFSPDMVAACAKRFAALVQSGRVEFLCARAEELPYADGHFTKACTVNTVADTAARGAGALGVTHQLRPRELTPATYPPPLPTKRPRRATNLVPYLDA